MTESPREPQLGNATLRLNGEEFLVGLIEGRFQKALEVVLGEVEATEDVDREPRLGEVPLKNAQPPEQREDDLLRPALDGVQGEAGRDGHVPLEERVPDGGDDLPPVRQGQVEGDGAEAAPVGIHGDSSTSTPGPESPTAAPTVEASGRRREPFSIAKDAAAAHVHIVGTHLPDRCSCGWENGDDDLTWREHFATAVEGAVRTAIAEKLPEVLSDTVLGAAFVQNSFDYPLERTAFDWAHEDGEYILGRVLGEEAPGE